MKPNKLYEAIETAIYQDELLPEDITKMATKIYEKKKNYLKETRDRLITDMLDYIYTLCPDTELTDEDIENLVEEFINFEKIIKMVHSK